VTGRPGDSRPGAFESPFAGSSDRRNERTDRDVSLNPSYASIFHGRIEKGRIIVYRRIGILSFSSPGHFYPLTALGRRLQSRGHDVVFFQVADLESSIRAAGLRFRQIGEHDFPLGSLRTRDEECGKLEGLTALRCGIRGMITIDLCKT
jgi:hypothetical protein